MVQKEAPRLGERWFEAILGNGLHIRVVPKPGFFRKYAFVAVNYGAIDTAFALDGRTLRSPDGVAHYLEHKMFDLPDGNADAQFAALGGSTNAFTSFDMTAYYVSCTEHLEENLRLLLKMVSVPYFTQERVDKERGIIAQEIQMYEDSPDSRLYEDLLAAMFPDHPVRVPIAGSVESIAAITPETLSDCFRAFYTPANMILCVVGDVNPERVIACAEAVLPKARRTVPARSYGGGAPPRMAQLHKRTMEVSMPAFALGFRTAPPPHGRAGLRQEIVGDLACELLCGESSPLYRRLYEENRIDSGFGAGYECFKEAALLSMTGDSRDPERVRDAILTECRRQLSEGLDAAAFRRLKRSALGRRIRELDSFESVCIRTAENFFDHAEYCEFPELYEAVTLEEVRTFLEETVCEERMTLAVVEPKKGAEA